MKEFLLIAAVCIGIGIFPSEPPEACLQSVGDNPSQCGPGLDALNL